MPRPALSALRALSVLDLMAAHPNEVFSLSELAERIGMSGSSAHAILAVLTDSGYLVRHETHKTYALGPAAVALGNAALERHPGIDLARDEMRRVADELGLELLLLARISDELVAVSRVGLPLGAALDLRVGQRVPLHPPVGSVFLAWSDAEEIDAWLRRGSGDAHGLEAERHRGLLSAVRRRGYSVGLEVESRERARELTARLARGPRESALQDHLLDVYAELAESESQLEAFKDTAEYRVAMIMAPIFDSRGRVSLAYSASGFRHPQSGAEIRRIGEALSESGLRATRAARSAAEGY